MQPKDIDEVESLIQKYKTVITARDKIKEIKTKIGGKSLFR